MSALPPNFGDHSFGLLLIVGRLPTHITAKRYHISKMVQYLSWDQTKYYSYAISYLKDGSISQLRSNQILQLCDIIPQRWFNISAEIKPNIRLTHIYKSKSQVLSSDQNSCSLSEKQSWRKEFKFIFWSSLIFTFWYTAFLCLAFHCKSQLNWKKYFLWFMHNDPSRKKYIYESEKYILSLSVMHHDPVVWLNTAWWWCFLHDHFTEKYTLV